MADTGLHGTEDHRRHLRRPRCPRRRCLLGQGLLESRTRSAAYAARHIAKNMVAAGIADEVLVEASYAIGIARPLSVYVDTYRSKRSRSDRRGLTDGEIARRIERLFDPPFPAAIVKRFRPRRTRSSRRRPPHGHFGNRPYTRTEKLWRDGHEVEREIEYFGPGKARRRRTDPQGVRTLTLRRRRRKNGTTAAKPSSPFSVSVRMIPTNLAE